MSRRSWMHVGGLLFTVGLAGSAAADAPVLRAVQGKGAAASIADRTPAAFVVTSPQGVKVFLDVTVVPPDLQPALDDPRNVFLASHDHPDHMASKLLQQFKGITLRGGQPVKTPGSVFWTAESGDVRIQAIASSHLDDELDGRTNTIFVVDVAGVRVVHMGDCGQTALSAAQQKAIGRADVVIHLLESPLDADADVANQKAYKLLAELAPTVVVPTHVISVPAVKLLEARYGWRLDVAQRDEIALTPALLSGGRRAVFMGVNGELAAKAGVTASGAL
jgi:L-ascorbate metabolism protein UlaG (beta-lactamase superfamily)